MDCSHGVSVYGHLQARMLEWVAISSSRGSSPLRDWTWVSCMTIRFLTNWATTGLTQMPTKSPRTWVLTFPPWFSEKSTHHHKSHAKSWGPSSQAGWEVFRGSAFLILHEVKSLSHVRHFVSPGIVAYQVPMSMGFSRHEYWNRLPFPSGGDLSHPGIEPGSPTLQADSLMSEPPRMVFLISHPLFCGSHGDNTPLSCSQIMCFPWLKKLKNEDKIPPPWSPRWSFCGFKTIDEEMLENNFSAGSRPALCKSSINP